MGRRDDPSSSDDTSSSGDTTSSSSDDGTTSSSSSSSSSSSEAPPPPKKSGSRRGGSMRDAGAKGKGGNKKADDDADAGTEMADLKKRSGSQRSGSSRRNNASGSRSGSTRGRPTSSSSSAKAAAKGGKKGSKSSSGSKKTKKGDDSSSSSSSSSSKEDEEQKLLYAAETYIAGQMDSAKKAGMRIGARASDESSEGERSLDEFEVAELARQAHRKKKVIKVNAERDVLLRQKIADMRDQAEREINEAIRFDLANRAYQHHPFHDGAGAHSHKPSASRTMSETSLPAVEAGISSKKVAQNEEVDADSDVYLFGIRLEGAAQKRYRSMVIYLFLILLGALTALTGATMDILIGYIRQLHFILITSADAGEFAPTGYLLWVGYGMLVGTLAAFLTEKISPTAVGSGIPEVKCILNGVAAMLNFLSFRTLISKVIGLSLSIGSGLWVGKEGPYIHTSAVVCQQLFRFFRTLRHNNPLKLQLIGAAVGVGVASNFGAVLGGVMFSIEATSTYYPVRNYWYSAVGCGVGGLIFRILHNMWADHLPLSSIIHTSFSIDPDFSWRDVGGFLFLGITTGMFSAAFVKQVVAIIKFRKKYIPRAVFGSVSLLGPIWYTFFVITTISLLSYPRIFGDYMSSGGYPTLQDLVNAEDLGTGANATVPIRLKHWQTGFDNGIPGEWRNLLIFMCIRFVMTPFAITAGVPAGLYVPTLLIGAAWGRLVGHFFNAFLLPSGALPINPGGFAVVAAAATTGAITQTYSTAIIVLELTGQLSYSMPVILGTTISIIVVRMFVESIFSEIANAKSMNFLDELQYWQFNIPATVVMKADYMYVTRRMHLKTILNILEARPANLDFPVVRSVSDYTLVGSVERGYLEGLVYEELTSEDKKDRHWYDTAPIQRRTRPDSELNSTVLLKYSEVPFQLLPTTPLSAIHVLFVTLRLKTAFVTERGQLRGIIGRYRLRMALAQLRDGVNAEDLTLDQET